jgi:hypothetical protein
LKNEKLSLPRLPLNEAFLNYQFSILNAFSW